MTVSRPSNAGVASSGQPEPDRLMDAGSSGFQEIQLTSYSELLKDPRWQKKRLECLDAAQWHCEDCGDGTATLHVHHPIYVKGRKPWEYAQDDLQVLCVNCHTSHHAAEKVIQRLIASNGAYRGQIYGIIHGYMDGLMELDDDECSSMGAQGCPASYSVGVIAQILGDLPQSHMAEVAGLILSIFERARLTLNPVEENVLNRLSNA